VLHTHEIGVVLLTHDPAFRVQLDLKLHQSETNLKLESIGELFRADVEQSTATWYTDMLHVLLIIWLR